MFSELVEFNIYYKQTQACLILYNLVFLRGVMPGKYAVKYKVGSSYYIN